MEDRGKLIEKSVEGLFWVGVAAAGIVAAKTVSRIYDRIFPEGKSAESDSHAPNQGSAKIDGVSAEKLAEEELKKSLKTKYETTTNEAPTKYSEQGVGLLTQKRPNVYTVVFTGGPCAGKSTALTSCAERLKELGFPVICVTEAATLIFSSGGVLNMVTYTPYQAIEFQKNLMRLQIALEDIFTRIVTNNNDTSKTCFVLCDRGLMDGSAYLQREQWEVLLNEMGLYEQDIKDYRYDLVIHLTTAADGAEKFYHTNNNAARHEDLKAAVDLDRKVKKAWSNHPNYFLITNDVKDFQSKIKLAEEYILKMHGYPINTDFSTKYLLSAKKNIFERIVSEYGLEVFTMTDTFLDNDSIIGNDLLPAGQKEENKDRVVYLRKREHNSRLTFLKGSRYYTATEANFTIKRNIMWNEYMSSMNLYKDRCDSITRKRCMALIADKYLMFEIFEIQGLHFITMIVQSGETFRAMSREQQMDELRKTVPQFIMDNVVKDITDLKEFRQENMAKKNWTIDPELVKKLQA